jgi:hypothetical protein
LYIKLVGCARLEPSVMEPLLGSGTEIAGDRLTSEDIADKPSISGSKAKIHPMDKGRNQFFYFHERF